jgi:hypothetical protein
LAEPVKWADIHPLDDFEPPSPRYYREKGEEIRQAARRATNDEIAYELFEIAERFDRMAAYAERRER